MRDIWIQKAFRPVKLIVPPFVWKPLRGLLTGLLVPILFSARSGHFASAIRYKPVSKEGNPIPWYTYPCIDFLAARDFSKSRVLEFGGGNSTIWWAKKAASVVTLEDDAEWCEKLRKNVPNNVSVRHVAFTKDVLAAIPKDLFDIVIIDGLDRGAMVPIALEKVTENGAIICDNAEGFGFYELLRGRGFKRVDFYGYVPGVVNPHATSIYFKEDCFLFSSEIRILDTMDIKV